MNTKSCCCYAFVIITVLRQVQSFVHLFGRRTEWVSTRQHKNSSTSSNSAVVASSKRRRMWLQYGLYEVQEELITERAILEEELMKDALCTRIEANKPKGAGTSGGFKSGSVGNKKGKITKCQKKDVGSKMVSKPVIRAQALGHAQVIREQGVVRIDDVLSGDVADALSSFVADLRATSQKEVDAENITRSHRFADVLLRKNRCDLTMPFNELIYRGLYQALCQSSVGATLEQLLGKDAVLYEFSCLISDPGSDRQVVHPDTPLYKNNEIDEVYKGNDPVLFICFIALQDVKSDMGPTLWLPCTHTQEHHRQFFDETIDPTTGLCPKDALLQSRPAFLGTLPKGCCGIYDSRLLHCGTANRGNRSRAIFYFSFKNPKIGYPGNPASIRPELSNKLSLGQLQGQLESFKAGQGCPALDSIAASMR